MRQPYALTKPDHTGMLDVGEGHRLYWDVTGNPDGKPVVVLHGGPGSGSSASVRRFFDPAVYRVILFDQRSCGRSTPHAGDASTDLAANTTWHLVADIERLRVHLGIARWMIYGSSWGSTLALAYAQRHPTSVNAILLVGVTMTRRSEINWLYRDVAPMFPAEWARFRAGAQAEDHDGDLVVAYYRLLHHADAAVRDKAAKDWHDWESGQISVNSDAPVSPLWLDADYRLARARIITHYFVHNAWLEEDQLLRDVGAVAGIPGILIHGRLDLGAPLVTAWQLAQAWPMSELVIVKGAGHSAGDPGMSDAILAATDRLGRL